MEFTIQRKYLLGLGNWLMQLSLQGQDSRNRTKFVEQLSEEVKEQEETRLEIIKKYATIDETTGEPVLVKKEGQADHYDINDANMPAFEKEISDYLNKEYICGGPGLKTRLLAIKDIVLNTTEKIDGRTATDYDAWCNAFENMKEE